VNWYHGLEATGLPGDHLAPLRVDLAAHYHVAKTFSNLDQIWERNDCPPQTSKPLGAATLDHGEQIWERQEAKQ